MSDTKGSPLEYAATNSARAAMSCNHYWLLRYGLRLSTERKGFALAFGSFWHELMDGVWQGQALNLLEKLDAMATVAEQALSRPFDPGEEQNAEQQLRMATLARRMLSAYIKQYGQDGLGDELRSNNAEVVWVERVLGPHEIGLGSYSGKIDKLLRINGELWIGEHKTSGTDLRDWRERNEYSPQPLTYAVLVEEELDEPVRGVLYDVAFKGVLATPEDFKLNKDGSISRRMPRFATREAFAAAIDTRRGTANRSAWYDEYLGVGEWTKNTLPTERELLSSVLFRRELVPFERCDIARRREEMEHEAETMRDWHEEIGRARARRRERAERKHVPWDVFATPDGVPERFRSWTERPVSESGADWRPEVVALLAELGTKFPRNGSHCYRWNRPCELMAICQRPSVDACAGLEQRQHTHAELTTGEETK